MSIGAMLNTNIPLHPDNLVSLRQARVEFYIDNAVPGLALGGQIAVVQQSSPEPVLLDGEVSIDLTGRIYGQGVILTQWVNPMGLCPNLTITRGGLGFGADFKAGGLPAPILAVAGGFKVTVPNRMGFDGAMTLGLDTSDPTNNMIDAEVKAANLYDIVQAFFPQGVPPELSNTFKKINMREVRLTVASPGNTPTIEVLKREYKRGVHIQGIYDIDQFTGSMLVSINDSEVVVYAGMSKIVYDGLSITASSNPNEEPEAYIEVSKNRGIAAGFLAIDGKVQVLGASAEADIYLSDKGFSLNLDGKIFNQFHASLDMAGTDLFKEGSLYVKASMNAQDNLVEKISKEASEEIDRLAKKVNGNFEQSKRDLVAKAPLLKQKELELSRKQQVVREAWAKECAQLKSNQQVKLQQEQRKQTQLNNIKRLKGEISNLRQKIASQGTKPANTGKSRSCPSRSKKAADGKCYTCPNGYGWLNSNVVITKAGACVKAPFTDRKAPIYKGKAKVEIVFGKPPQVGCPSGQYYNKK